MKDYQVSYYLNDMYDAYVVTAENEGVAIQKVLRRIINLDMLHDFKIERYYTEW